MDKIDKSICILGSHPLYYAYYEDLDSDYFHSDYNTYLTIDRCIEQHIIDDINVGLWNKINEAPALESHNLFESYIKRYETYTK